MLAIAQARRITSVLNMQPKSRSKRRSCKYGIVKGIHRLSHNSNHQVRSFMNEHFNQSNLNTKLLLQLTLFFVFLCRDLTNVLRPFKKLFHFEDPKQMKFGQLVLPQLPANYGPMYFCKIQRNEN